MIADIIRKIFFLSPLLLCATVVVPGFCVADTPLYAVYGPRGSVTFTSRKPVEGKKFKIVTAPKPSRYRFTLGTHTPTTGAYRNFRAKSVRSNYDTLIQQIAQRQGLEPALVKAVVHVESAFQPHARSPKGAAGLMQLMPATAKRFGVYDYYHPAENLRGGTTYLRWLLQRYRGNLQLALAAYNSGEGTVDRYGAIPPYRETIDYVQKVKKFLSLYRCDFAGATQC